LANDKQSIKRLNSRKVKLYEVLSFERHLHNKIGLSYDEFNKAVVDKQTLTIVVKKGQVRKFKSKPKKPPIYCNYYFLPGHRWTNCLKRFKDLQHGRKVIKPEFDRSPKALKVKHM
jgi:hypothetical protein